MKLRIYFYFLINFACIYSPAQSKIHFENISLDKAQMISTYQDKPIFLMGFASWCPHCKNMSENVFTDSLVADFYNENFICLKIDLESDSGIEVANKFDIESYPTFIFLDKNATVLYRISGEFTSEEFINEGKNAENESFQLPYLKQQFESSPRDYVTFINYALALQQGDLSVNSVANKYLSTKSNYELLSSASWKIISAFITDIHSNIFQFVIDHRMEYTAVVDSSEINYKIYKTVNDNIRPVVERNDTTTYYMLRNIAKTIHLRDVDSLIYNFDLNIYEISNSWESYKQTAVLWSEYFSWNSYNQLIHVSNQFLKHGNKSEDFEFGTKLCKRALDFYMDYRTELLHGLLLEKKGDRIGATAAALSAEKMAIDSERNYEEAEKLLWRLRN